MVVVVVLVLEVVAVELVRISFENSNKVLCALRVQSGAGCGSVGGGCAAFGFFRCCFSCRCCWCCLAPLLVLVVVAVAASARVLIAVCCCWRLLFLLSLPFLLLCLLFLLLL